MKHLRSVFLCSLIVFIRTALAQDMPKMDYTVSSEYDYPEKHWLEWAGGNAIDGYMQLEILYSVGATLQKFDANNKLVSSNTKSLEDLPYVMYSEKVIEWNGKYYWFYTAYHKKERITKLFCQELDFTKGAFTGEAKQIAQTGELQMDVQTDGVKMAWKNQFKTAFSADSSKLFVYAQQETWRPADKKNPVKREETYIHRWTFDRKFQELTYRKDTIPYEGEIKHTEVVTTDNQGNCWVLLTADNAVATLQTTPAAKFNVYCLSPVGDRKGPYKAILEGKVFSDFGLIPLPGGGVICLGYYSNFIPGTGRENWVDGIACNKIDNSTTTDNYTPKQYVLPSDVRLFFQPQEDLFKNRRETQRGIGDSWYLDGIYFEDAHFNADGSITTIAEDKFHTYYYHADVMNPGKPGTGSSVEVNKFGCLLVQKIDVNGQLTWSKVIVKIQEESPARHYVGVKSLPYKDGTVCFYFDSPENANLQQGQELDRYKPSKAYKVTNKAVLIAVYVDSEGNAKRANLGEFDPRLQQTKMLYIKRIGNNTLFYTTTTDKKTKNNIVVLK